MTTVTLAQAKATWRTNTSWWRNGEAAPELERAYAGGESYLSIAARYGTNPKDIYTRVSQLGLVKKYPRLRGGHHPRPDKGSQKRTCLKCRQIFKSAGPHNRICPDCKRRNATETGMDF